MEVTDNRKRNRILLLLFLGVLMGALDIAIVAPAQPAIQRAFGIDARAMAWIIGIYALFNLVGTPFLAKLSDIFGRRSIYVLAVAIFGAGSLVVAFSNSFTMFLAGRAIQGFGAGGIFPVASAVIGDTFPREKRGGALGLIGAVFGLAFLIGPPIGGIVLSVASWQWLFLINIPIAIILIIGALRLLPDTHPATRKPFDFAGMISLWIGLVSLAWAINQIDTANLVGSLASISIWPLLLLALAMFVLFYYIETKAQDPIVRVKLFASRQLVLVSIVALGAGLAEATLAFVPPLLVDAFGISDSNASYLLIPAVLAMLVGAPLAGRMIDRSGSRLVIILGTLFVSVGLFLASLGQITMLRYIISAILVGGGLSMLLGAPLRYIVLAEVPATDRAAGQGALTLFTGTGLLIGSSLIGAVAASSGGGAAGFQTSFLVVSAIVALMVIVSFGLKGRQSELETAKRNDMAAAEAA